jgi:glycosyltransferase involved in cell wall biosynthesis
VNILHLLSNYRWTERAEPAVLLAWAEHQAGAAVTVASGGIRKPEKNSIQPHVLARGLESVLFELPKHFRVGPLLRDARALRAYLVAHPAAVIHCHMVNAHTTAVLACRTMPKRPRIVRSCYEPEGLANTLRERVLMRRSDGLIVNTEDAQTAMVARYPWLRDRVAVIPPGIDTDRFAPDRVLECPPEPAALPANAFVVGIVSRLRAARRIDLVVRAVGALAAECPDLHLMVVGQGGSEEKVHEAVTQPALDSGCADRVHLVGYRKGDTLVAAYRRMNVLAYPEPGTDRSCRTVREAMAAGLPVVAARVGYLPHLVEHEATGLLAEQTVAGFTDAFRRLYRDRGLTRHYAENSLASARRRFGLSAQAAATLAFYRRGGALSPP